MHRWLVVVNIKISIHAPREGGDRTQKKEQHKKKDFNPRPPRGGRLAC